MGTSTYPERLKIEQLSKKGLTDRQIADQLGFSIATIRKWRRIIHHRGKVAGISHMGRPSQGPLCSFSQGLREQVKAWRSAHPGWGAKTIHTELSLREEFREAPLPSQASLARWLKAARVVREYEKHTELPHAPSCAAQACHEEWEMDARGYSLIPHLGLVSLIDINDIFSHIKLLSFPCWLGQQSIERYPATEDYQLALRLAFTQWGLPDRLATDHDRIFYDQTSKSPFPTRFQLWLVALGIDLQFGRMNRPTDQAMTEHSHQIWEHQVLDGAVFEAYQTLWQALERRKVFLNEHLPCASLGERPPLQAYPQARCPRRSYRPEWEPDLLDLQRVYTFLAQGHWFRKVSAVGTISIARHIYTLGYSWRPEGYVELSFDPIQTQLLCRAPSGKEQTLPVQWLSKQGLMGELFQFQQIPFQWALPFSFEQWRALFYEPAPAQG
jgi:hypothetical protein